MAPGDGASFPTSPLDLGFSSPSLLLVLILEY